MTRSEETVMSGPKVDAAGANTLGLLVSTTLSVYAFCFFEWIFLATGLSFVRGLSFPVSVGMLLSSAALIAAPFVLLTASACALARIAPRSVSRPAALALLAVPVAIQTWLVVQLVDNFTYTMFSFGILTAGGVYLWGYRLALLALFVGLFLHNRRWLSGIAEHGRSWAGFTTGLLLLSLAAVFVKASLASPPVFPLSKIHGKLPNILFLASDGIPSVRMGVYGYERSTTPFQDSLADKALIFTNAFSNSNATFPATSAMFTGKSPYTTKIFYRHTPLKGNDADQHLPAILNQMGYRGIQVADRTYANSLAWNMRNAFAETFFLNISWIPTGLFLDAKFAQTLSERMIRMARPLVGGVARTVIDLIRGGLQTRAAAATLAAADPRAGTDVAGGPSALGDQARVDLLLRSLAEIEQPFYAHLHLLETHCCPRRRGTEEAAEQAFDAAVRRSDGYLEQILSWLQENQKLDDTVIVISSDHSRQRYTFQRIPLMILFPHAEHAGVVDVNVQLLDVAPTILSYLGQPVPDWMEGESLLSHDAISPHRPLFGFHDETKRATLEPEGGPFPPLGIASLVLCDQWFYYPIPEGRIVNRGHVEPAGSRCPDRAALGEREAQDLIEQFLSEREVGPQDMPPGFAKTLARSPLPESGG